jgi:hypothetical protein
MVGFLTDKNGHVDLPIPTNEEFKVSANLHSSGIDCNSRSSLLFNTEKGIQWREANTGQSEMSNWNDLSISTVPIRFVLEGAACKP